MIPRQSGCGEVICFEESCTRETETGEERLPGKSRHGWEQDAMVGNLPMPPNGGGHLPELRERGCGRSPAPRFLVGAFGGRGLVGVQDNETGIETGTDTAFGWATQNTVAHFN